MTARLKACPSIATISGHLLAALMSAVLVGSCCPARPGPLRTLPPAPPSQPPLPEGPPEPGALNRGVVEMEVSGVLVIFKRRPANDIVLVDLMLRGGVRNLTRENAGVEMLALSVGTEGGTTTLDKDELAGRLEMLGTAIDGHPDRDYSTLRMSTIRQNFDAAWALFDDVVRNPAFPDDQVVLHKERQLTAIRQIPDNPDRFAQQLVSEALFDGHPYLNRQLGFEDSVAPLDANRLRQHWRSLVTRDRALVVVVGDLDPEELRGRLEATLSRLPAHPEAGPWDDSPPPQLAIEQANVRFAARDLPTTYVLGGYAGPTVRDEDFPALVMGVRILSNRFFEEVRTKRNLSYAVSARLQNSLSNWGQIYVTAQDPETTLGVMFAEIERLQREPVSDRDLHDQISLYLTDYFMNLQTNAAQAELLGHWEIVAGGRQYADEMVERLKRVTSAEVQAAALEYLKRFRFGVVGPHGRFADELYRSH